MRWVIDMRTFPLNVLKYTLPLIFVFAVFSLFSGSTLYFFISFIFFLIVFTIIYPFYENSYYEEENEENVRVYEREQEILEKKFDEAKNGNPVAQRLIEERVFRIALEEISDRTGKSINEILDDIGKDDINMDPEVIILMKKLLNRRNSLEKPVDGLEFENDICMLIDNLGG